MTWGSYLVARGPAGASAVLHLHHRDDGVRVVGWRGPRRVGESLGDDALAFLDEGGEELLLGDDANDLALAEDRALALAGGDADIGVAGPPPARGCGRHSERGGRGWPAPAAPL